jgi:hypothetical protein
MRHLFAAMAYALALVSIAEASDPGVQAAFAFNDFLLAPLRIHLLQSKDVREIATTLTVSDIERIISKVNRVWAQAGVHFYVESLLKEDAANQEFYESTGKYNDRIGLLPLRPKASRGTNCFHVYYVKQMGVNGIHFEEANFVKDTASLREVEGGIDEPLPRVTSHELGHGFSLPHRQNTTNLMASGTTGIALSTEEIQQARMAARQFPCVETADAIRRRANALYAEGKQDAAQKLYARLASLPVEEKDLAVIRQRAGNKTNHSTTN